MSNSPADIDDDVELNIIEHSDSYHADSDDDKPLVKSRKCDPKNICGAFKNCCKKDPPKSRTIRFTRGAIIRPNTMYPPNVVRNQKYRLITFLPIVLFEQFKYFFNLYFLLVGLSQFIPALQVGFLFTYISPLAFVLAVTIMKEAYDDFKRYKRDQEANSQRYEVLDPRGTRVIPSSDIQVGDLVIVHANQRVPCDMVLLRTTERSGASFIRTDQLDGETDWKLRRAVSTCQKLAADDDLFGIDASLYAEAPKREIYDFIGTFTRHDLSMEEVEPLSLEHTLWSSTVVASGTVIGLALYTGSETRSVMNTSAPATKFGKLDLELNRLSKVLVVIMIAISLLLVALKGFRGSWLITLFRFMLLLSSIIPISLRVNLDMAKTVYSVMMMKDKEIPGTIVRTSTIPEELGRVEFLFSDKTGTLTRNEMEFRKLHIGVAQFGPEHLNDMISILKSPHSPVPRSGVRVAGATSEGAQLMDAIISIALCHNVTPVDEEGTHDYQASSPDEVALVRFAESVGMRLEKRTLQTITIRDPDHRMRDFEVLSIFPFTSQSKRMGIIVRDMETNQITFYMKGADAVMAEMVLYNEWLEEECGNMAREGLRTLVYAKRSLTEEQYNAFNSRFTAARASIMQRDARVAAVIASLERDLQLIAVTGVEDKLQDDVKESLEMLRSAGIKIWMLTGDKVETATCVAISTKLVSRTQTIFRFEAKTRAEASEQLNTYMQKRACCLVIDGASLQICLDHMSKDFIRTACNAPAVVCCRCSPTQKADIVRLMKTMDKQTCGVGDGGNDVGMIQAADVGIGIVGKEGKQAALAADFSINQFSYLTRLLLWHGRNSYKRSARLAQFVIHRGFIISVIQAVFSAIFYYSTIAIYTGWLMVGYTTLYTMAPVFSLVLDEDVPVRLVFVYPELYRELQKGRGLSMKTFFYWIFKSIYQGGIIMVLAMVLFEDSFINIVGITFTALILAELMNVCFEIHKWHWLMVAAQLTALGLYVASMFLLRTYFDITFIATSTFWWKTAVITAVSCLPIYIAELIVRKLSPPSYTKITD